MAKPITNEQLREQIDRLLSCQIALRNHFLELISLSERACGAINVTDSTSPQIYVEKANERIKDIKEIIKKYEQNLPQDFEIKPTENK